MTGQSALLIGATGQTGQYLLKELLGSAHFTRVGEYGRRVTPLSELASPGKEKLEQEVVDFEKIQPGSWSEKKWDVLFITLGTTRALAGSVENFEKIDREYVVNAAKAAKVEGHDQRIVYLSSAGSNPKSYFLYTRSKGLTEEALASMGYSDTIIFRPAMLRGRQNPTAVEKVAGFVVDVLAKFSQGVEIHVSALAKSMRIAGELGSAALPAAASASTAGAPQVPFVVIDNEGAIMLSKT